MSVTSDTSSKADSDPSRRPSIVHVSRTDSVLRLVLDRPSARNALTPAMVDELITALTAAASDDSLRAVHIIGAGETFCAGSDWVSTNSGDGPRPRTGDLLRRVPHSMHRLIELVQGIHLPVVCTVHGWAVGLGANLALAADFTLAADDAVIWEPFIARGFTPDSGASWLLPRLVGLVRARRMILLGEKISGAQAAQWGLIHDHRPADELDAAAEELLDRLASGPTVALGLAKAALADNLSRTLPEAMNNELHALELSCRAADFKEGLSAFTERRDPRFTGR